MFQKFFVLKNVVCAAFLIGATLFVTSCTQTDYSALKPNPIVEEAQKKQQQQVADYKAKIEAQKKAYLDSIAKSKEANGKTKSATKAKSKPSGGKKKTTAKRIGKSSGVTLNAPWKCVPNKLKVVINQVSRKFGHVTINSTHRSRRKNRRVGGARRSWHIGCRAVDFRVRGRSRGLYRWLRNHPNVGGLKRYRSGFYHIDIGPRRSW